MSEVVRLIIKKPVRLVINPPNLEIWKPVYDERFSSNYQISSKGRIKNKLGAIIIAHIVNGYYSITFSITKDKVRTTGLFRVHVLMARAFISNPNNKLVVNHINGNKLDNRLDNLEWSTQSENSQHAVDKKLKKQFTRAVIQLDIDQNIVKRYDSILEASNAVDCSAATIRKHCNNGNPYLGFYFKFETVRERSDPPADGVEISCSSNYLITPKGEVYSTRFNRYIRLTKIDSGYLVAVFSDRNMLMHKLVHRLVAEAFIPNPNNKLVVNHINGIKDDNRVENLEWVSQSENMLLYYA